MFMKYLAILFIYLCVQINAFGQKEEAKRYYNSGFNAFNNGLLKLSKQYIDSALQLNEWYLDAIFLRANLHELQGETVKAIADYEKIVFKDKGYLEAYLSKSLLYYQRKNYEAALEGLKAIDRYKGSHETQAVLFKSSVFGPNPGGDGQITEVTTIESLKNDILYLKSLVFKGMGEYHKAKKILNELLDQDKSPDYYVLLGLTYEGLVKGDSAKLAYENALRVDPKHSSAAYQLQLIDPTYEPSAAFLENEDFHYSLAKKAHDYYLEEDYESALTYYHKAIKIGPGVSDYYSNRGLVYEKLRKYELAIADYSTSLKKDSHMIVNYYRIGNVKIKQKAYQEAVASYRLYLSYVPDDADIHYNLGISYLNLKKYDEACLSIKNAEKYGKTGIGSIRNKYCNNP